LTLGFLDGEYQDGELRGLALIAGKRGMGKTTEMARLLSQCGGGVVFFDSLSKHESILSGYKLITQPGDLAAYLKLNRGRRFRVLYQPRAGDQAGHFQSVCTIVRAIGWMIFGVDELDMQCGPRWGDSRMPPALYHLVNYGRHERISMLATARTPMSVARGYTSACLSMRIFQTTEESHKRYFEGYIGAENAAALHHLEKYQFLHWRDGDTTIEGGSHTRGAGGGSKVAQTIEGQNYRLKAGSDDKAKETSQIDHPNS
jgi:hypothetical protein